MVSVFVEKFTQVPTSLQPLRHHSGNIKKLIISKEANSPAIVKGLMSAEGETLDLIKVLRVRGNVEAWMGLVESAMFEVVRHTIKGALLSYSELPYAEWWKSNSGQVIILGRRKNSGITVQVD